MTELEKITDAKLYIDKMANGINPIDDSQIPESDLINNVKIARCLFFISEILNEICMQGGNQRQIRKSKTPYQVTQETLSNFPFSKFPVTISEIVRYLNNNTDTTTTKKLPVKAITEWLIKNEYLTLIEKENGKQGKMPTEKGNKIGIIVEQRIGQYGNYQVVLYSLEAQKYIIDNLEFIIAEYYDGTGNVKIYSKQGEVWTAEQDASLKEMFSDGLTVAEMSKTLQRTPTGIRARLKRLGLISNRADAI